MVTTRTRHATLAGVVCAALIGCGTEPAQMSGQPAPGAAAVRADANTTQLAPAVGTDAGVAYPLSSSPSSAVAGAASVFATRNAVYRPVRFGDLPGWGTDEVEQSWEAFKRSCSALASKPGWSAPCTAARGVDARNAASVRRFFEENFTVYQILNVDRSANGLLTGYYEPTLNGSRKREGAYVYPVYGVPRDMLFLDQRRLPPNARDSAIAARIEGRNVIPLSSMSSGNLKGVYALELGNSVPDIRDKKLRLRQAGNRIVPYYSRAEIERGHLNAPVLAYVDDPAMLYSMQLQGAGRIHLPDGSILRLAYAEQNGFAFEPPLASASTKGRKILVRGVEIDMEEGELNGQAPGSGDAPLDDVPQSPLLRNGEPGASSNAGVADGTGDGAADSGPASPLLRGFNLVNGATPAVRPERASLPGSAGQPKAPQVKQAAQVPPDGGSSHALSGKPIDYLFATSDPSYVFFKPIPDSVNGPIGALGVPLSAGRSAAIDPRTTPLGAPVFVTTSEATPGGPPITRLMMAQDAGGAIRGAVRVDYFFGSGPQAQAQASRTRQPAQMWVLLPNGLKIAAKESRVRVRGAAVAPTLDCVVSDPDLCVESGH
ncbi:MltA domain-containing protein [Paraburkholderia sp. MMS20-SJTR3]|uniref:peptidoglycan lytic exotransglycosylase n=1 Tax=Paraburkholderia sejongensis TaxID=2886946 RepID=A0ABS8JS03_9BURK|nr:MltA domain-containing protein [Paraburkholderia sp. MMS20-SJTR3]MCC8392535.1 MltA domain-containing protein [Paraburkholderia sp. MMS20-SJTR3]